MLALDRLRFNRPNILAILFAFCIASTQLGAQEVVDSPKETTTETANTETESTEAANDDASEATSETAPEVDAVSEADTVSEAGAGQSDLEEAIVKRIDAEDDEQLEATAALLQSAITKGLDKENESFAKKMLGSVLLQRAQKIAIKIASAPGRKKLAVRDEALEVLGASRQERPRIGGRLFTDCPTEFDGRWR